MKHLRLLAGSLLTVASLATAHPSYANGWNFQGSGWVSTPATTLEPENDTEAREVGWSFTPTPRVWARTSHSSGVASISATYQADWTWTGGTAQALQISRNGSVSGNITDQGYASSASTFGITVTGAIAPGSSYSATGSHGPVTFVPANGTATTYLILSAVARKHTAYALATGEVLSATGPMPPGD